MPCMLVTPSTVLVSMNATHAVLPVDPHLPWHTVCCAVQGVHMQSNTKEGTYRNDVVSAVIKSHNLATRGLAGLDNPGSLPTY